MMKINWLAVFSGQSKKTQSVLIEKSIFKAYYKKIKLIKSPLPGGQQVLKGSEPSVNSWDNSNKIFFNWLPTRYTFPKLILQILFFVWMIFSGIHRGSCGQKCEIKKIFGK